HAAKGTEHDHVLLIGAWLLKPHSLRFSGDYPDAGFYPSGPDLLGPRGLFRFPLVEQVGLAPASRALPIIKLLEVSGIDVAIDVVVFEGVHSFHELTSAITRPPP